MPIQIGHFGHAIAHGARSGHANARERARPEACLFHELRQYFAQISGVFIGKAADAVAVNDARARQSHAGVGAADISD